MRAEGFAVTSTEAKDVGIYRVMEAESTEREKEEVMDRIWAVPIFKRCLDKNKNKKTLEQETEEQAGGLSNVEVSSTVIWGPSSSNNLIFFKKEGKFKCKKKSPSPNRTRHSPQTGSLSYHFHLS